VALLDRESFLDDDQRVVSDADTNANLLEELINSGIRTYLVKQGIPLATSLTSQVRLADLVPSVNEDTESEQVSYDESSTATTAGVRT
jgi:hypothetical protein